MGHEVVRDLLAEYHVGSFSNFRHRLPDGRLYEFAYFEYVGADDEGDMAALGADPRNRAWLARCDPMHRPLAGEASWAVMACVCHIPCD
jgi:L-rhamnose mutarotase